MSEEINGEAHRSVVQMRLDKADADWKAGRKDEAFATMLSTVAMLSSAIALHSRTYVAIVKAVDELKEANAGPT
jgi:hypothetical protein